MTHSKEYLQGIYGKTDFETLSLQKEKIEIFDTGVRPATSLDTLDISSERPPEAHAFITVLCSSCGSTFSVPVWCGDRLCPICARRRQAKYQRYLILKAKSKENLKNLRFITFTVQNQESLDKAFNDLRKAIKRLKDRDIWKNNIIGGCYSIEVTKSNKGWHVHVHIVAEGKYILQADLSKAWKEVTDSNSYIVDIRKVKSYKQFVKELSKYPFKPADAKTWNEETKKEFNDFIFNRRLFTKFGSWYNDHISLGDRHTICPYCGAVDSYTILFNFSSFTEKDAIDQVKKSILDSLRYRPLEPIPIEGRSLAQCLSYTSFNIKRNVGFFFLKLEGYGDLFLSSFGAISVFELKGNEFKVDTGHLVAFEDGVDYTIQRVGGLKSTFLSGEGLVARLWGNGKVMIQTRSPATFSSWLYPFLPKQK